MTNDLQSQVRAMPCPIRGLYTEQSSAYRDGYEAARAAVLRLMSGQPAAVTATARIPDLQPEPRSTAEYAVPLIGVAHTRGPSDAELDGLSHELWAAAQLASGEGVVAGVDRIAEILRLRYGAQPAHMPVLTDAMRAVLRNESVVYQSEDALYEALVSAAGAGGAPVAQKDVIDAARWRYARTLFAVEDIEQAAEVGSLGTPDEANNERADLAIDTARQKEGHG